MEERFYRQYFAIEDRHWWFVGRRRVLLAVLDRYLGRSALDVRSVLDVGCGTGAMLPYLARYGEAHGVDASDEAVQLCAQRGVERVQRADVSRLPFGDARFDLVTAFDVIEHTDDDLLALLELRRVSRPGGMILLSVPAFRFLWGPQDEISHHRRRYVAEQVRQRLIAAGWSVVRVSYFNTLLFPAIAVVRLLRPRSRKPPRSDFELTRAGRLNDALGRLFGLEASVLPRVDFPFGVSILGLAINDGDRAKTSTGPRSVTA